MAMANEAANQGHDRQATRQFFSGFWPTGGLTSSSNVQRLQGQALANSLIALSESLDRTLTERAMQAYVAVLSQLSREEAIKAFSRALEECRYFPTPSQLLEFAGRTSANLTPMWAAAFGTILKAMRTPHGLELRAVPGKIIREKDDEGLVLVKPEREPETPAPTFDAVTEAAICIMGHGSREAGLEAISRHPAVHPRFQQGRVEAPTDAFAAKTAADLEKRWAQAYAEAEAKTTT
jgi:hypothetical protein